ncbi:ABC transporter permease [Botryobacter ruber]|uniref:ABC transporter permease n=1 Tax=Botryobacter ruber TaxID=2171629 RepID=UPI000E0BC08B|nr:ABC transporter permease [Botryobacter ruber]
MIRHLFKLIWNRKKSNFLLITEIFFSFMVLFAVLSFVFYNYCNYTKPLGFDHQDVWQLTLRTNSDSTAQNRLIQEQLLQRVKSFDEVEHVSLSNSNVPFAFSMMTNSLSYGSNKEVQANVYDVQDDFKDVMKLQLQQGRWFGPQDDASRHRPIVINLMLKQKLFGEEEAIGKLIPINDSTNYTVIGVMDYYRAYSEFNAEEPAFFSRINLQQNEHALWSSLLIRVKPGTGVAFEEKMVRELSRIAQNWTLEVTTLEKMRKSKARLTLVPMIALGLVCGFLIFNVALGLFGVLWHNINRRHSEIGLRRALGASSAQIYRQFIGEVLVLATFGLLLGVVFAIQLPLLEVMQVESVVYISALFAAVGLIYLLTALCAFYPSRQAAAIQPAVALHEE